MVTYNDPRFTYNNEGLTYNGSRFYVAVDNSSCLDSIEGYKHIIKYSINHNYVGGDLTNYPAYIDLSLFGDYFWYNVKNGGGDIRIYDSNLQECPREIVSCDTATKTGEVHTLIPSVSASADTVIYIYYGNPSASDYLPTDTYGSQAVWGSNHRIYHSYDLTSSTILDSKGNYNGTKFGGANSPIEVDGKFGKAQQFDGVSNIGGISIAQEALDPSLPHTFVAWIKLNGTPDFNNNGIIDKFQSTTGSYTNGARLIVNTGRRLQYSIGISNVNSIEQIITADTNLAIGNWYFVAGIYDGTNIKVVVNNQIKSVVKNANPINRTSTNLRIGNTHHSNGTFDGIIDEARVYQEALSTERLTTEYNNQNEPASFYNSPVYISSQILNIGGFNFDTSINTENVSTYRVMVISVNDAQSTTDNTIFNIGLYQVDTQSLLDNTLNTVEFIKQDTVSSSDDKLINTLAKNVDIIYITENSEAIRLLLSKIKPGVVGFDKLTPIAQ